MKHNILVFSSLFPSNAAPTNGLFIRERMFRVAEHVNLTVVSPVPWFPGQQLGRMFKKNYRPQPEKMEIQQGITVYFPRFLSFPGVLRNIDGFMMYLCSLFLVRRLRNEKHIEMAWTELCLDCTGVSRVPFLWNSAKQGMGMATQGLGAAKLRILMRTKWRGA